jgi:uncharacterized Zn-binding protein involved in type VI secretion
MPRIVRVTDQTACTDPAVQGSPDYIVNGLPVHRLGDGTGGHGSWVPNAASEGASDVITNGLPTVHVGHLHIGHASPTPNPFHRTAYVEGSPDTIIS